MQRTPRSTRQHTRVAPFVSPSVSVKYTTRGSRLRLPFAEMAKDVLGAQYELSVVVCGDTLARAMNVRYRKKDYAPNVLSFPLAQHEGEIFLNIRKAVREAQAGRTTLLKRAALLYVHGLFHLKGLSHGTAMERQEARILARYGFSE